ncbi:MAG: hypothetical protein HFJ45_08980 [Clostridia bacterium]|nr:hypothetical protein [Clostridia bacterium]
MKDNIISFFLTVIIILIILVTIALSLDLCGIVSLPEKLSLKTYLANTVEVVGFGNKGEVYYPDYEATGVQNITIVTDNNNPENNDNYVDMSQIISNTQTPTNYSNDQEQTTIVYGNITDNSFYYNQLDTYGKTIYSRLYSNLDNLKTGTYSVDFGITFNDLLQDDSGDVTLTNAFQLAINALLLDHPEIFYLDVTKMYMFTESSTNIRGTTYKISIGPDAGISYLAEGFQTKSDVLIAEDEINTILYSLKSNLSGDTYTQIKQIHDYLIDTIEYDSTTSSDVSHTLYGALVNKYAVCDGYAKAFKFILDNLGISCVEVCGIAQNSSGVTESHAWNDVLLDGKWYAIDITWDDPIIIGGNGVLTNDLRYNYFLKGSDTFYSSHQEDGYIVENGKFDYPIISNSSY